MNKSHLPLIGAIAIPLVLIAIMSLSVYLPNPKIKPEHDFIYATSDSYVYFNDSYDKHYNVQDERIILTTPSPKPSPDYSVNPKPIFYRYNVKTGVSRKLSSQDLNELKIDDQPVSVDGYQVLKNRQTYDSSLMLLPFFLINDESNQQNIAFIKSSNGSKKIHLISNTPNYSDNFRFIGWVKSPQ